MIIVYISGGLGNQMFQYAFSTKLKKITDEIKYDITIYDYQKMHSGFALDKIFDVNCERATKNEIKSLAFYETNKMSKIPRKLFGLKKTQIVEEGFFNSKLVGYKLIEIADDRYYQGYWQSYKYFDESIIQKNFIFVKSLSGKNYDLKKHIEMEPEKYCCIHIRRGDYLTSGYKLFRDISTTKYYANAIDAVISIDSSIKFLVFSDDINWVRNNIQIPNAQYIYWNNGINSYIDMQLMSLCKYIIIANSTFSWWAAYLNPRKIDKYIFTPDEWFNGISVNDIELLPKKWLKIDSRLR